MTTSVKTGLGSRTIAAGLDAATPGAFSAIPIVDLQLDEAKVVEQVRLCPFPLSSKPAETLYQIRDAATRVGFLYARLTGVETSKIMSLTLC